MKIKSPLLATSLVSVSLLLSACGNTVKQTDEMSIAEQKTKFEQQIAENNKRFASEKQVLTQQVADLQAQKLAADQAASQQAELSNNINAGDAGLFPPNAELGHCYSRVLMPATYTTTTGKVLVEPASDSVTVVPAKYQQVAKRVMVKEASEKIVVVPATYKSVTEKVMISAAHTHLKSVAAVYETVTEQILDKPAHTVWKRGAGFQSSALETKIDNGTGEIMCLVEVPATYKTLTKRVLKTPAKTIEDHHPAEYKDQVKQVVDRPATTKTVPVPAQYKTIMVREVVAAEKAVRSSKPAIYKDVTTSEKVAAAQLKWEEVLCEDNMTAKTIVRLQQLLKKANHYHGPIDGVYGSMTEKAVNAYAKANNLPTGSRLVSLRTADHIGL